MYMYPYVWKFGEFRDSRLEVYSINRKQTTYMYLIAVYIAN